jgi:hypothetical protein
MHSAVLLWTVENGQRIDTLALAYVHTTYTGKVIPDTTSAQTSIMPFCFLATQYLVSNDGV